MHKSHLKSYLINALIYEDTVASLQALGSISTQTGAQKLDAKHTCCMALRYRGAGGADLRGPVGRIHRIRGDSGSHDQKRCPHAHRHARTCTRICVHAVTHEPLHGHISPINELTCHHHCLRGSGVQLNNSKCPVVLTDAHKKCRRDSHP